jgi:uncharacterized membrane protein
MVAVVIYDGDYYADADNNEGDIFVVDDVAVVLVVVMILAIVIVIVMIMLKRPYRMEHCKDTLYFHYNLIIASLKAFNHIKIDTNKEME